MQLEKLFKTKWVHKYMNLAKSLAETNDACYSRKIGCVLVSKNNRVISTGYNGALQGISHCDSDEWIDYIKKSRPKYKQHNFCKKECPRRSLNIPSGEELDICALCSHAERNALYSCARYGIETNDSVMYCWCGIPCIDCTRAIISCGVVGVVCLESEYPDYSPDSRQVFKMANVKVLEVSTGVLLNND